MRHEQIWLATPSSDRSCNWQSADPTMSVAMEEVDLIIVGGGMVGMTLAAALAEQEMRIVVVERAESSVRHSLGIDCRVSAIVRGGVEALQGIGAWQHLHSPSPIMQMRIWDDQHSGGIRFDGSELQGEADGLLGMMVQNSHLLSALRQVVLCSAAVELCCPVAVQSLQWQRHGVVVELSDGRKLHTPLIVAADGGRSWLRAEASIGVWSHDLQQRAIVATIKPQRHHQQVAYQRFLPTGPLALLPMDGGLCSIVWSAESSRADRLMAMDDAGFLQELNRSFGPQLGVITACGQRAAFPLRTQLARHFVRPRLALIGDAAHSIHPLAGLGVNLGIRDAMVLAREIVEARRFAEDYGAMEVLAEYRNQRLPDVLAVMGAMEGLHHLFTSQLPGVALLRAAGLRMIGNSASIKQLLMRNSTGLALSIPRSV
ncbi:MAG: UbiH/UbiF/VisC/COQ6 family ubiquinone biosynthesis hydroxylase [Mariprofundales bacterium]|nr:UbiH/UbiF/VisC/COQ6 family ubiquinone biosynthesis hydroxylase [Mariprofundales bacterium]